MNAATVFKTFTLALFNFTYGGVVASLTGAWRLVDKPFTIGFLIVAGLVVVAINLLVASIKTEDVQDGSKKEVAVLPAKPFQPHVAEPPKDGLPTLLLGCLALLMIKKVINLIWKKG